MYTAPLNCSHSQVLRNTMAARTDPHTESQGVEFLIAERYVSNNHAPIMNLRRHMCVYEWVYVCVCVCVCVCVQSSPGYFVRPITLPHHTVQGAGSDKQAQSRRYSASSRLHRWVHFKDQTWWRRHDCIKCGSLFLEHGGKHGGHILQNRRKKRTGGRIKNSLRQWNINTKRCVAERINKKRHSI